MKYLLPFLLITFIAVGCQKQQELQTTVIKAGSMVCGTCAETIEKTVYHVDGVKEVNIDMKAKTVEIKFVPLQTNTETIELAISDAGYDANDRKRNADAYEKLDACCKIDG